MQLSTKVKPTLKALTEVSNYKNRDVIKHYGNMEMSVALSAKTKGIGQLAKQDEEATIRCISNLFRGTSLYFGKEINEQQSEIIAEELLVKYEYRSLKLEDILAICVELKESEIYNLTPARVMRQIAVYTERREKMAIKLSQQKSQDAKSNLGESNIDERVKKSIRHIERSNEIVVKQRLTARKFN